jgi:phage gpG-like protein
VPEINTNTKPFLQKALRQSATYVRWKASKKAPYKTWTLRRSIVEKVSWLRATVWTNVVYARIHEYGWIIRPKKAGRLVFKKNWKLIFAKQVRIPKRPYMIPALQESQWQIRQYFANQIQEFINQK